MFPPTRWSDPTLSFTSVVSRHGDYKRDTYFRCFRRADLEGYRRFAQAAARNLHNNPERRARWLTRVRRLARLRQADGFYRNHPGDRWLRWYVYLAHRSDDTPNPGKVGATKVRCSQCFRRHALRRGHTRADALCCSCEFPPQI